MESPISRYRRRRKLLAELSGGTQSLGVTSAAGFDARLSNGLGSGLGDDMADAPVLLTPHGDSKADAFADLLGHIDDGGDTMLVDEKAALAVAKNIVPKNKRRKWRLMMMICWTNLRLAMRREMTALPPLWRATL